MLETFATGDLGAACETVAEGYCDHEHDGPAAARRGRLLRPGAGGAQRVHGPGRGPEGLVTERDQVTAQLHWRGVLPSGDTVDRITIDMLRLAGRRAVERWTRPVSSRLTPAQESAS